MTPSDLRPRAKVVHVSDCHLGADRPTYEQDAFVAAIDLALAENADAVLITGDLFDHGRVDDDLLEWTAAQLDRLDQPIVLLPGNHDLFALPRFDPARRCRLVHLIADHDGEVVDIEGAPITVWGRAMKEHEPSFRPLAGAPTRRVDRWCIVAGHGLFVGDEESFRSSPITSDDLAAVECDYVALGHVHQHRSIGDGRVPAFYAGATGGTLAGSSGAVVIDFVPNLGAVPRWVGLL